MLKVAVCDDEEEIRRQIGKAVGDILFARGEYEIIYYHSGEEIRQAVKEKRFSSHLLLLDIHMESLNGVELAAWLRQQKVDVDIIFVTVSKEHVYECYTYKAFAYILKPVTFERLQTELNRYVDEIESSSEYMNISVKGYEHKIALERIRYFESNVRKIRIYLENEEIEFYGKLDELEELLGGKGFIRCHQSYLVNQKYITAISRNGINLSHLQIPVSRKYWDILRKMS